MTALRCIRLKDSAFGQYYHRLIAGGMKKVEALMAVMRKMLLVAYHLLRTEETYDPRKVGVAPAHRQCKVTVSEAAAQRCSNVARNSSRL
jgi:hypothetical protein